HGNAGLPVGLAGSHQGESRQLQALHSRPQPQQMAPQKAADGVLPVAVAEDQHPQAHTGSPPLAAWPGGAPDSRASSPGPWWSSPPPVAGWPPAVFSLSGPLPPPAADSPWPAFSPATATSSITSCSA